MDKENINKLIIVLKNIYDNFENLSTEQQKQLELISYFDNIMEDNKQLLEFKQEYFTNTKLFVEHMINQNTNRINNVDIWYDIST